MIKTIIDFIKESKEASQERLKLPIVPFYIFLLIISYWKPISIYFLSEKNIEERIKEIDLIYINYGYWDHIFNLLILLFLSTISSILFPSIMFIIEYLLKTPNKERKIIKNSTKNIDREEELKITEHKYKINKILSGNKEVEDYNQSIEDLKKSYEDRIQNIEAINLQKDKNLESQIDMINKENISLNSRLDDMSKSNKFLNDLINQYRLNEFEYTNYSKFNKIFENKDYFKDYINSLGLVADKGVFIIHFLSQIIDYNLHSLLNRLAICVYTNDPKLNLNKRSKQYNVESNLIKDNKIGELISESDIGETFSIEKNFLLIKEMIDYVEVFEL
ncbi:endonuclease III [Chryseobacterium vietnamense]|uniref:hypothetical protein n=1 Tax=Chryseobacterium vietnamense TaxID=866785 RepID=UPI00285F6590|nr:hypothetical protein [Chryseobacterium vietnamense]MDR6485552.1 endonuclease III [Chryseobacterium vietnamense]